MIVKQVIEANHMRSYQFDAIATVMQPRYFQKRKIMSLLPYEQSNTADQFTDDFIWHLNLAKMRWTGDLMAKDVCIIRGSGIYTNSYISNSVDILIWSL